MSVSEGFTPFSDVYSDPVEVEVLEHYEINLEKHKDERDNIQKKTFTKWVNKHLTKYYIRVLNNYLTGGKVDDLFKDLQDGFKLIALLEALTGERLIKLVNIRPEDIVEGNGKLTLGLIWTIILNFQVSVIKQRQHEEQMQQLQHRLNTSPSQVNHHSHSLVSKHLAKFMLRVK
uniref:Calponin-homology (CH) domain-containing protein n=1 Tax=Heterorhabditis bacteriophora TaxID=37862 RepID=A0A1I7XGQ6_HETBA